MITKVFDRPLVSESMGTINKIRDLELLNKQYDLGNFFQSREFYEVLRLANLNPFIITASKPKLSAGLLAYTLPGRPIVSHFFPNLIVYYGPILAENADKNALDILLRNLDSEAEERRAIRVDIRTPSPFCELHNVFEKNGYVRYDPGGEYSIIIDLTRDEDTLWSEMRRNTRRAIRKAAEKKVKIREVATERDVRSFYEIYASTAERRKFTPYPFSFLDAFRFKLEPKGVAKFFLAWYRGRPIAGILNTIYNGQSVPFIAASLKEYWKLYPNHLLFWHSICWSKVEAKAEIFKLYHLPRSRSAKNGIDYHMFKTSFGGKLVRECAFYYKVISPFRLQLLESIGRLLHVRCHWTDFSEVRARH